MVFFHSYVSLPEGTVEVITQRENLVGGLEHDFYFPIQLGMS